MKRRRKHMYGVIEKKGKQTDFLHYVDSSLYVPRLSIKKQEQPIITNDMVKYVIVEKIVRDISNDLDVMVDIMTKTVVEGILRGRRK